MSELAVVQRRLSNLRLGREAGATVAAVGARAVVVPTSGVSNPRRSPMPMHATGLAERLATALEAEHEIGRASCRERVYSIV
jgi:hypothetical protein